MIEKSKKIYHFLLYFIFIYYFCNPMATRILPVVTHSAEKHRFGGS